MAKIYTYDPFKRGDTVVFAYTFTPPSAGFSWAGVVADFALTAVESPTDNSGAGAVRLNQSLTINDDGTASLSVQLTTSESKALKPDTDYSVEVQLKDGGGSNVGTAFTGTVNVEQDYII